MEERPEESNYVNDVFVEEEFTPLKTILLAEFRNETGMATIMIAVLQVQIGPFIINTPETVDEIPVSYN